MDDSDKIDVVVIGAGVVGAALAQRIAARGRSVVVLEKHTRIAEGITSRNSGVVHSGIYYPQESLKTQLCIRGKELLYTWAQAKSIPHRKTGKAIVATSAVEQEELERIFENAKLCGATGLVRWSQKELRERLPGVLGLEAVFASETGIVDPFEFTRSLLQDAESNGAMLLTDTTVSAIRAEKEGYYLQTTRGPIETTAVVNAAGLYADKIAALVGVTKYRIHPWRGDYFRFRAPVQFEHLVYPVKVKGAAGLGIHLTLDLAGGLRLGPDVEPVTSKEDFSLRQDKLDEKLEKFRAAAEKLFGPVAPEQLQYDQCGLRPKLRAPDEAEEKDFVIAEDLPGFLNLVGIESPGLTSALAIAEYCEQKFNL